MKVIRIKDNALISRTVFDEIPNLTERIADKTLDQLEREGIFVFPEIVSESKDITEEQMILQKVYNSFRTENVMGYLGYGNERMIIESRFCKQNEDYFFRYLLEKVLDVPNIIDLKTDTDQDNRLFNYLLFLFPYYLRTAMRKGLYKQYSCHRYNDGNVKGTVDIARHIRKNSPFISRDSKDRVVADAKYKPIGNIGNDDYLQVLAYMFRFNAKTGFCLYPDSENTGDKRLWLNSGTTFEANVTKRDDFCLIKRGLRIPVNAESYDEFAAMMQDNEIEFRRRFG